MFLNELSYQEKRMFLDLSVYAAKANDELVREEKELLNAYCREMNLPPVDLLETEPRDTVLDYFSLCDDSVKRIVLFELLGLVYVDGSYDDSEKEFIERVVDALGIDEDTLHKFEDGLMNYYRVCKELNDLVK